MKYMISWFERPQGSPMEYENAQKRILEVFTQWKAPENFKIELFVIRVGDWGGYMLLDCDDPLAVHKFCSMLPAFEFQARPVIPVMDAVRVAPTCRANAFRPIGHLRQLRRRVLLADRFLTATASSTEMATPTYGRRPDRQPGHRGGIQ